MTNIQSQWYYSQNGGQAGPVSLQQLGAMVSAGQIRADDLVWTEGMAEWKAVGQVAALQSAVYPPASPNQYAAAQPPAEVYPAQAYSVPYSAPVERAGQRRGPSQQGMAIAGFVLSFIIPLLGLIFSLIALNGMKKNNNPEGKGLATAGLIISCCMFALACLWFIMIFAVVGAGAAASGGR